VVRQSIILGLVVLAVPIHDTTGVVFGGVHTDHAVAELSSLDLYLLYMVSVTGVVYVCEYVTELLPALLIVTDGLAPNLHWKLWLPVNPAAVDVQFIVFGCVVLNVPTQLGGVGGGGGVHTTGDATIGAPVLRFNTRLYITLLPVSLAL
jgi:hypothetical protein